MTTNKKIGLVEAVSIAVGTMIGASIFSIFGLGAKIAEKNLPEAFILSALLALVVAYSYATLGSKIVSNAGPIAFILKGFGDNLITGMLSFLMWLSNVVSIALFAKGFAGYFLPLVNLSASSLNIAIVELIIIAFFTALNFFGSKAVGHLEFYIVILKILILGLFIIGGLFSLHPSYIVPSAQPTAVKNTLFASVIFFLSYMGFGLVTNASEDIENPEKNVPKAIYISIAFVSIIYVLVALVAIGNLSIAEILVAQENTLAEAAKPFLGSFGYLLLSIGALFSISSALNATIFGGANIAYSLAKDGELPEIFERKLWFKSTEGLFITSGLALVFAFLFNIGDIASITSSIFIIIYIFVVYSHSRLTKEYGGKRWIVLFNLGILVVVLFILLYYQWINQRSAFYGLLITLLGTMILEIFYRKLKNRVFKEIS